MSTVRTNIFDEARGNRHKRLRNEVLKLKQDELAEKTGKSQSTISNYDKGQMPSEDYLVFLHENQVNLHWFIVGEGNMIYSAAGAMSSNRGYGTLRTNFDLEFSDEPLFAFTRTLVRISEFTIDAKFDAKLSESEKADLLNKAALKVKESYKKYLNSL